MALDLSSNPSFTGRITAPTSGFPYGSGKDDSTGVAGDGTQFIALLYNDVLGIQQALLTAGGITPDDVADTALLSQYLHGIIQQVQGRATLYDDSGAADAYRAAARTNQQTPNGLFEGQRFKVLIANTNTTACTLDVSKVEDQAASYGVTVLNIKLPGGVTDPAAGTVVAGQEVEFAYRTSPSAHVELVKKEGLQTVQVFTSSGSYTPTPGTTRIKVTVIGGGGGGGNAVATSGNVSAGDGGGGGGCAIKMLLVSALTVPETVTIGAGGAGGAVGTVTAGAAGGTTSFGAHASATGGGGGPGAGGFTSDSPNGNGTAGGLGTGGDLNFDGQAGFYGFNSASQNRGIGGYGGGTFYQGNGPGTPENTAGTAGTLYGEGGGGASNNDAQASRAGGDGSDGLVIIEEYV